MVSTAMLGRRTLQLSLSSGIDLIVLSMLFLGRDLHSTSFIVQAASVLAVPLVFYAIGLLVYRYLDAPLAAPGIVATGACWWASALFTRSTSERCCPLVCSLATASGHPLRL